MQYIEKSLSPRFLVKPVSGNEKFVSEEELFDKLDKQQLREFLLDEQGYICCYCTRSISIQWNETGIEHYLPRTLYPSLSVDYKNLLIACSGGDRTKTKRGDKTKIKPGDKTKIIHCNVSKGDIELNILDPRKEECEDLLKYDRHGKISPKVDQCDQRYTLIEKDIAILNLNNPNFVAARKSVWEAAQKFMEIKFSGKKSSSEKRRILSQKIDKLKKRDSGRRYEPFNRVQVFYFKKKISGLPQ